MFPRLDLEKLKTTSKLHSRLRDDHDFADVTLAYEDGNQIEAHKVIMSGSSPFSRNF